MGLLHLGDASSHLLLGSLKSSWVSYRLSWSSWCRLSLGQFCKGGILSSSLLLKGFSCSLKVCKSSLQLGSGGVLGLRLCLNLSVGILKSRGQLLGFLLNNSKFVLNLLSGCSKGSSINGSAWLVGSLNDLGFKIGDCSLGCLESVLCGSGGLGRGSSLLLHGIELSSQVLSCSCGLFLGNLGQGLLDCLSVILSLCNQSVQFALLSGKGSVSISCGSFHFSLELGNVSILLLGNVNLGLGGTTGILKGDSKSLKLGSNLSLLFLDLVLGFLLGLKLLLEV